jgi:ABC-type Fe3+-hydroxamate transport system substrate-binding protein
MAALRGREPVRVVSLLPSATEIVHALAPGAAVGSDGVRLVGRSHECDWPRAVVEAGVPVLTAARTHFQSAGQVDADVRRALEAGESLYTLDIERLDALKPDVIVTQDLCAVCSIDLGAVRQAAARMSPAPAIVSLNPQTLEGVFDDVLTVGQALGLERRATELLVELRARMYQAQEYVNPYTQAVPTLFLEWTEPMFVGGHWTPQLIERAGGEHPLNPTTAVLGAGAAEGPVGQTLRAAGKSIVVNAEQVIASKPEAIVVAPCGLTLEQAWSETEKLAQQSWWRELPAVRRGNVAVVDGNQMFNRPGPRLADAFEFLVGFLNEREDVIPAGFPWRRWKG